MDDIKESSNMASAPPVAPKPETSDIQLQTSETIEMIENSFKNQLEQIQNLEDNSYKLKA